MPALPPRTPTVAVLAACVCALACVGGASGLTGDSSPPAEEDAAAPIGGAGGSPPASRPDAAPIVDRPAEPAPDTESPPDATPDRPTPRPDGPPPGHGSPFATWWDHPVSGRPTWSGPMVAGQVAVTPGKPLGRLSPNFVGFSFEKTHLTDGFFTTRNARLVAPFKLLGPGVVRLGGHDVDKCTWVPTATPLAPGHFDTAVGSVAVDELAAFLATTGWRVIYGLNLRTGTAANMAAEAAYASSKLGPGLYGFEIGNEVNLFGLTYEALRTKWESFAAAIRAMVPGAPLIGPATNQSGLPVLLPFTKDEADKIILVTHHYYRGSGSSPDSTMDKLLSPNPSFAGVLHQLATVSATNHIRDSYRIGETNSFSSHGTPGVSDAFGAALWAIDYMFDDAEAGSTGVNFHGGATGMDDSKPFYYAPIKEGTAGVEGPAPLFYGMLLVSFIGPGDVLATTASAGTLNFVAHAVAQADGATEIVLINKDATTAVNATVDVGASVNGGSAILLEAPALTATTGVKLAGATISAAGEFKPQAAFAVATKGTALTVVVPPGSAVLVRAR